MDNFVCVRFNCPLFLFHIPIFIAVAYCLKPMMNIIIPEVKMRSQIPNIVIEKTKLILKKKQLTGK
jgi:hypothetical protein